MIAHWPAYAEAMAPIRRILLECNEQMSGHIGRQHLACGDHPAVHPFAVDGYWIPEIRSKIAIEFGLPPQAGDVHHPYSPWRFRLLEAIQARAGDGDTDIIQWLRSGAPLGICEPIVPGGAFPAS